MQEVTSGLRDCLRARNKAVFDETVNLVNEAQPLLWHTLSTFPSGTSHTPEHTATVEQIASMLIPDAILELLNDDELQLLVLGCHYHDLGMAGTEKENATPESQEQARRDHAIRIGDVLKERWQEFRFRDHALADALAQVCRGHRPQKVDGIASWDSTRETGILAPGRTVRLRVVSALVYAADELHIGADRATVKEEQWLQIMNEESRRHWRRHQLIQGPAVVDGHLRFEVLPPTVAVERDLRTQVLRKALLAIRASNELLAIQGIEGTLRPITIAWNRDPLWRLLVVRQLSDLVPRSTGEIRAEVMSAYTAATADFEDLTNYFRVEYDDETSLSAEIDRVISDYCCRGYLQSNDSQDEALVLNTDMASANVFFRAAKQADELDVLFEGRYAAHYDFELQRSPYGIRHAELSMQPTVHSAYGLLPTSSAEKPISELLQLSPTARRLAIEGSPSPGVLSKPHVLALTVLSGASLDLLRDPTLILGAEFRTAYKTLTAFVINGQNAFTRLMEELALVDGYTHEQLCAALNPSPEGASGLRTLDRT